MGALFAFKPPAFFVPAQEILRDGAFNSYLCTMKFRKAFALTLIVFTAALFVGCAATRKAEVANILRQSHVEFTGISFDSAQVDFKRIFGDKPSTGILPNPQAVLLAQNIAKGNIPDSLGKLFFAIGTEVKNPTTDTLYLRAVTAEFSLDSAVAVPVKLLQPAAIVPGTSAVSLHAELDIDSRVLKVLSAETIRLKGSFEFSLAPDGETVSFDIDESKKISPEDRSAFIDKARNSLLSTLIDKWSAALPRIF